MGKICTKRLFILAKTGIACIKLTEVTVEKYETICWDYDALPGH